MKYFILSLLSMCVTSLMFSEDKNVHDFTVKDIYGKEVQLSDYEGKVLVIVNTASKCGHTKQYADLVKLQQEYAEKGVVVLGFPANNFGKQEPGTNEEILEFCSSNFGVDFPMFSKVSVKGEDKVPLFQYLTAAANPEFTGDIKCNFEKFVVDGEGVLRHRFRSGSKVTDLKFQNALNELLATE
ncbi:glutathione peroxidase [Kiritimatiellaeota bacterium B1221]|nr:glutathione peroxidase [Kiritimatiellaeota bacterium B1221]